MIYHIHDDDDDLSHIGCSDIPCQGTGWYQVTTTSWEQCLVHYKGQLHPQDKLLHPDPALLAVEEEKSRIQYKLGKNQARITELTKYLGMEQKLLAKYELELTNHIKNNPPRR